MAVGSRGCAAFPYSSQTPNPRANTVRGSYMWNSLLVSEDVEVQGQLFTGCLDDKRVSLVILRSIDHSPVPEQDRVSSPQYPPALLPSCRSSDASCHQICAAGSCSRGDLWHVVF